MGFEIAERISQQFHNRLVNSENNTQNSSGNTGKNGAQTDQGSLYYMEYEFYRRFVLVFFHFLSSGPLPKSRRPFSFLFHYRKLFYHIYVCMSLKKYPRFSVPFF